MTRTTTTTRTGSLVLAPLVLVLLASCGGGAEAGTGSASTTATTASSPPAPPPSRTPQAGPGPLDGRWTITWTADDLAEALGGDANPMAVEDAERNAGTLRLEFDRGRYDLVYESLGDSCPGTFVVEGDRVVMTATTKPTEWDCGDGLGQTVADAAWAVDGDELRLTDWNLPTVPDMSWFSASLLGTKPLQRLP